MNLFKTSYFWWSYKVIILSRVTIFTCHTQLIINIIYIGLFKPFKTLYPCGVIKSSRLCKPRFRPVLKSPQFQHETPDAKYRHLSIVFRDPYHVQSARCSRLNFSKDCTMQALSSYQIFTTVLFKFYFPYRSILANSLIMKYKWPINSSSYDKLFKMLYPLCPRTVIKSSRYWAVAKLLIPYKLQIINKLVIQ